MVCSPAGGADSVISLAVHPAWDVAAACVRSSRERELLASLRRTVPPLEAALAQIADVRAVSCSLAAVWERLLVCRRSELIACVPLAAARREQAQELGTALEAHLTGLVSEVESLATHLAAFASVNRATAEELTTTAGLLVRPWRLCLLFAQNCDQ